VRFLLIISTLAVLLAGPCCAQVNVTIELDRSNFLLYEPVKAKVTVYNNTDHDVALNSSPGNSWLSFLMTKRDGRPVHPDNQVSFTATLMKAGEARAWVINLTPLMSFRDLGEYKVRAVLDLPGQGQLISTPVQFNLGKGQTILQKSRPWEASERTFSLVRFSASNETTQLYARVEDAKENVVYATYALGEIIAMTDPETLFDREGNWHVMHVTGSQTYRYSRIAPDGKLLFQDNYTSYGGALPSLAQIADGSVKVQGGQAESENKPRVRLSESQSVLPAPKPIPELPKVPVGTPSTPPQ
jgi:hypothetical protein